MANLHEAQMASERAWETVQSKLHIRPSVVGIIPNGTGFGLKITLPRMPKRHPPASLFGVPVEYDIAAEAPALTGDTPRWRKMLRSRTD
jgi:hypothetical protein